MQRRLAQKSKPKTKRVVFYLLPETHRESKARASLQGLSMSGFAEKALRDYIDRRPRRNAKGAESPESN